MKIYETEKIRNIAVMGHGKTGKTSLLEACLFNAGATKRHGKVDDGSSVLDYSDEENRRKMSITMSLAASEWKDYKLNFLDTPGYPDFVGDVKGAATAADSALIVISAPSGIEVETEKAWGICEELNLPRAFFVNKMDREHANFDKVVEELRVRFGAGVVPVQLPIGQEETFQGVADLISLKIFPSSASSPKACATVTASCRRLLDKFIAYSFPPMKPISHFNMPVTALKATLTNNLFQINC